MLESWSHFTEPSFPGRLCATLYIWVWLSELSGSSLWLEKASSHSTRTFSLFLLHLELYTEPRQQRGLMTLLIILMGLKHCSSCGGGGSGVVPMFMCTPVCRGRYQVFSSIIVHLILKQGLSLNPELADSAMLAIQPSLGILPYLPPQLED